MTDGNDLQFLMFQFNICYESKFITVLVNYFVISHLVFVNFELLS